MAHKKIILHLRASGSLLYFFGLEPCKQQSNILIYYLNSWLQEMSLILFSPVQS